MPKSVNSDDGLGSLLNVDIRDLDFDPEFLLSDYVEGLLDTGDLAPHDTFTDLNVPPATVQSDPFLQCRDPSPTMMAAHQSPPLATPESSHPESSHENPNRSNLLPSWASISRSSFKSRMSYSAHDKAHPYKRPATESISAGNPNPPQLTASEPPVYLLGASTDYSNPNPLPAIYVAPVQNDAPLFNESSQENIMQHCEGQDPNSTAVSHPWMLNGVPVTTFSIVPQAEDVVPWGTAAENNGVSSYNPEFSWAPDVSCEESSEPPLDWLEWYSTTDANSARAPMHADVDVTHGGNVNLSASIPISNETPVRSTFSPKPFGRRIPAAAARPICIELTQEYAGKHAYEVYGPNADMGPAASVRGHYLSPPVEGATRTDFDAVVDETTNMIKITIRRARTTFHALYSRPRGFFSAVFHLIGNSSYYRPILRIGCPPAQRDYLLLKFLAVYQGKLRTASFLPSPYDNVEITAVAVSLAPPDGEAENLLRVLNHRLRRADLPMVEIMTGTQRNALQPLGQLRVLPLELLVGNITKLERANRLGVIPM